MQTPPILIELAAQDFSPDVLRRYWLKVNKTDGCWIWTAARDKKGYGRFGIGYRTELAHRISWMIHIGQIPPEICVLHECDNPPCVRPDHLFLGTHTDNCDDKMHKGRHDCGRILTELEVEEILKMGGTVSQCDIANRYDVRQATISSILCGRTWKHIRPDIQRLFQPCRKTGNRHHEARFTESEVAEIRRLYRSGVNMSKLGRMFGVSKTATRHIIKRLSWKHLP